MFTVFLILIITIVVVVVHMIHQSAQCDTNDRSVTAVTKNICSELLFSHILVRLRNQSQCRKKDVLVYL